MKKTILSIGILFSASYAIIACSNSVNKKDEQTIISNDSLISKGAYLVNIAGCGDCHSPKIMTEFGPVADSTRLFSGHRSTVKTPDISKDAFKKGWVLFNDESTILATGGFISYSANITSDETGIGNWSFEQFKTAMTKGKWKGLENSRNLFPPMPWMNYQHMKEEDLKAIFAFLKSTKPVDNIVPVSTLLETK
ncbi:MAG: diheme cytochrome c-553 [Chitinophagaceae bacterium]